MKAILSLLTIVVAGFFGYNHAESLIASRPTVEEIAPAPTAPKPVAPVPEPPAPKAPAIQPTTTDPEPAPAVMEAPAPAEPEPAPSTGPSLSTLPPVDFSSQTARVSGESPELESALALALTSGDWPAYLGYLRRSLAPVAETISPATIDGNRAPLTDPLFRQVLHQERFLASFPPETFAKHFAASHDFARWLLSSADTVATVIHNIHPKDDRAFLLDHLADLFTESNADLLEYTGLAVACAFVHDKADRPADANLRFHWYVDKHKNGKLFRDPRKMHISDLTLVVGATVPLDQLDWVQDKFRGDSPRSKTGTVYSKVKYRMDLAKNQIKRSDLYTTHSLAEIYEKGGVCADQAHFATHVCQALGIPAVNLSGSGNRGAHAWVGYQQEDGKWATHGRYEDYANGKFRHPQSRSRVIESELALRSETVYRTTTNRSKIDNALSFVGYLADTGDLTAATTAAAAVADDSGKFLPAWETLFDLLERGASSATPAFPTETTLALVKKYEIALRTYPDVLDRADTLLTEKLADTLDSQTLLTILERRRRRVESYDEGRFEAILKILRQESAIHQRTGDPDAVVSLYRQQLRKYGTDAQFFRKLAKDFWATTGNDSTRQDKALGLLNAEVLGNFKSGFESRDIFARRTACDVYSDLSGYYRKAGKTDRADQIKKRIDRARKEMKK